MATQNVTRSELIEQKLEQAKQRSLKSGAVYVVEVTIEGVAQLLQDRFTMADEVELQKPSNHQTGRKPEEDYKNKLFLDKDGLVCEPAGHIEASMAEAAGEHKAKGQRTYRRGFKAAVFVQPELIPHQIQEIEKLTTPVPNNAGAKTLKTYPKLPEGWRLTFYIQVHDEQIGELAVKEILETAGRRYGIGAWRPRNGRFTLVHWRVLKNDEDGADTSSNTAKND